MFGEGLEAEMLEAGGRPQFPDRETLWWAHRGSWRQH